MPCPRKFAILLASATMGQAAFRNGCAEAPWDSNTDFFLNKYEANDPTIPIFPEYNNTFVRIRNRQRREVVLHCTNEPPPRSVVGDSALIVKVPVQSVAALDGFSQSLIEILGRSESIRRTGAYSDVTSSCIRGNMMSNITYDESKWDKAEAVNVTFYGDVDQHDGNKVLIYNVGTYAPLRQLGYIKFISMFYGLEELANSLYNEIAASYRCTAAQVQEAFMYGNFPTGALISPIQKSGDSFTVFQSPWWDVLLADAGSRLVNVSADGEATGDSNPTKPNLVTLRANSDANDFATTSWAIIDTTQYDQLPGTQVPKVVPDTARVDVSSYSDRSGASRSIFALKNKNVFLVDKAENRNLRHNFFDLGSARPDLVIRDVVSIISPTLLSRHTTQFLRNIQNPDDKLFLIRRPDACAAPGKESAALNMTECALPSWASGYHATGISTNAYQRPQDVQSLALSGSDAALSKGQKAGIAIGSVVGFLLLAAIAAYGILRTRRTVVKKESDMHEVEKGSSCSKSSIRD